MPVTIYMRKSVLRRHTANLNETLFPGLPVTHQPFSFYVPMAVLFLLHDNMCVRSKNESGPSAVPYSMTPEYLRLRSHPNVSACCQNS